MKKKSVKHVLHFLLLCMPLILLLIACIFPTKQVSNTFALEETTTSETETSLNVSQIFNFNDYKVETNQNLQFTLNSDLSITFTKLSTYPTYTWLMKDPVLELLANHTYLMFKKESFLPNAQILRYDNNTQHLDRQDYILKDGFYYSYVKYTPTTTYSDYRLISYYGLNEDTTINVSFQLFDITNNSDLTFDTLRALFPLIYPTFTFNDYVSQLEVINTIGNQAEAPLQSDETKQPNEAILMPYKSFYNLSINDWYRSMLNLIGVEPGSTDFVQGYLLYFPLWAMWFWLFELIELAVTLVPKLVYDIYTKLSRSKDE